MSMRRVIALVAAALIAPAGAEAAPFAIGPGELPGVTVDGAGTAYIVWNGLETGRPPLGTRLKYAMFGAMEFALPAKTRAENWPMEERKA